MPADIQQKLSAASAHPKEPVASALSFSAYGKNRRRFLLHVILPYLVFSCLWILLSDMAIGILVPNPDARLTFSIYKGFFFILVTSVLLYMLLLAENRSRSRMVRALRESEARYRLIAENTDDVIWLYDITLGRFTYVSPSVHRLRGYTSQEAQAQSLEQTLSPESYELVTKALPVRLAAFAAGDSKAITQVNEVDHTCRDGSHVSTEVVTRLLTDETGAVRQVLGVSRNIQFRKTTELELKSQKAWLERAERVGKIGGFSINIKTRTVWASQEAGRIYGLTHGPNYSLDVIQKVPLPEYRPILDKALEGLVKSGETYDMEFKIRRSSDGEIVDIHSFAEYDAASATLFGVIQDITARKSVERKSSELATLLDIANDAICVRGLDHSIQYWNKGAEALYGWTAKEAVGRLTTELFSKDQAASDAVQAALLQHGSWSGERKHITRKGEEVIVFARLTLVRDNEGNPQAVMAINTDVTERKRLEAQLLRTQRLESLGALSSGIAHDLNNVLAPVLMSVSLLREEFHSATARDILSTIEASAQRGSDVVRQVLIFARGAKGERIILKPQFVTREILKIMRETFPKNIRIVFDEAAGIWPVLGDSTQIHQALMNLCVNARDAMPDGGTLILSLHNFDVDKDLIPTAGDKKDGPYVCLRVSDTGTGIPGSIIDKMFDPFFTTKSAGKGTGLGLSTVLGIIKGHDGFVRVHSEEGKGSQFELFFPAQRDAQVDAKPLDAVQIPKGSGQSILLVDDEAAIRDVVGRTIEANGFKALTACDGTEAVSLFIQHRDRVALVITDMMMPGMDGASLVKVLRRVSPRLPIIGMSGVGDLLTVKSIDALNLNGFLEKPCPASTLLQVIHDALAAQEAWRKKHPHDVA